jgi:hypothetical protein
MGGWELTQAPPGQGSYVLASWLFLRFLGVIYLAAFVSLARQIKGLIGRDGILPAANFLDLRAHRGINRFHQLPTLCWFNSSDGFLLFLAWGGAALALLLIIGFAPVLVLVLLWVFYLSLFTVCRLFLGYQWDILLLEMGFLAIFLASLEATPHLPGSTAPPRVILWLFWWLLFRLMFSSGIVKIRSGDATWRNFTALYFHYETQPLPTPIAWHAHQLPSRVHRISTVIMLAIEIVVPCFIFGVPGDRHVISLLFIILMVLIQLSGNYCFFNLQGIALSILLLDDRFLAPVFQVAIPSLKLPLQVAPAPLWMNWLSVLVCIIIITLSVEAMARLFRAIVAWPNWLLRYFNWLAPFNLVNSYGLFSVMTTERPEIIVEGSADGTEWKPYEFRWKPGDVKRRPRFAAPHQPRLDWQMWFAALGYYQNNSWLECFLEKLLAASPDVLSLLMTNPFPNQPPRYVRAILYDYRFTDRATRRATGAWWRRERRGAYSPIVSNDMGSE